MPHRDKFSELEREDIVQFSCKKLFEPEGQEALKYLTDTRGLSKPVIEKFKYGYFPLNEKKGNDENHELCGRIVLPIYNQYNELVAISSRDWRENAYMKFWHESYTKHLYLYGLNVAKKSILLNNKSIVVEGEFDVAYLHNAGFDYAVGMLGSVIHLQQIALLCRYCDEIYFMFDGDKTGRKSNLKAKIMSANNSLKMFGIETYHCVLPNDVDPDDFIKQNGKDEVIKMIDKAKQGIELC